MLFIKDFHILNRAVLTKINLCLDAETMMRSTFNPEIFRK